ncbi:hypothetical protein RIF29_04608 [Crotalaria pallida]|uniref:Uncharacterized protein n=1 Tax=Crotalaria pallida TaxID=3830 RepID=A0AAN9PA51_CROPI
MDIRTLVEEIRFEIEGGDFWNLAYLRLLDATVLMMRYADDFLQVKSSNGDGGGSVFLDGVAALDERKRFGFWSEEEDGSVFVVAGGVVLIAVDCRSDNGSGNRLLDLKLSSALSWF